jgi:RNA polymerase sigma-70 factor, ECF subfamily
MHMAAGPQTEMDPGSERGASQGEPSDLVELFRQYKSRAFQYAYQMLGDREDALDVTQEAFLRVHKHWSRRNADQPVAPWLYSIVRNLAIDVIRKRGVRQEQDCGEEELEWRSAAAATAAGGASSRMAANGEIQASKEELASKLRAAILALPGELREVLILREWHGLDYSSIARTLGVPATTVTGRLHLARQRLREQFRRYL